jgi:hypothetical protein
VVVRGTRVREGSDPTRDGWRIRRAGTNLKRRHAERWSTRRRTRRSRRETRRRTERAGAPRIAALLRDRAATSLRAARRQVPDLQTRPHFNLFVEFREAEKSRGQSYAVSVGKKS